MHVYQGAIHYSPSDLTGFMESPFASWMDRYALAHPDWAIKKDPEDALMAALKQKGFEHEDTVTQDFLDQGLTLVKIAEANTADALSATQAAMQQAVDVIVQGRLAGAGFAGFADFLVKVPGSSQLGQYHYEVWDAKLSASVKPTFVVQLCCYADMLHSLQGRRPDRLVIALGQGTLASVKTDACFYYYQALKRQFMHMQNHFDERHMPDPADSKAWGNWSTFAEQWLEQTDHLLRVATITRGQIKKLQAAGIHTMQDLAESPLGRVAGLSSARFQRLKAQATIQKQSADLPTPLFQILLPAAGEKTGLALLPPHSDKDVFFDIEGFPLVEGGLEYLWGCSYFDGQGVRCFKDFWAHNPTQEKDAFSAFILWVYARWQSDPSMHIYHYANYEIAACRKLMGRYGVCEAEVDQLLRNNVFIDLYKIVKSGLLLGEPRYSIKNVEHLYRPQRQTEVGSGGDSVVAYEAWRVAHGRGEQGDSWDSSAILADIRNYNIDDCESTQELVVWLRQQQHLHNMSYCGNSDIITPEVKPEIDARIELRESLLSRIQGPQVDPHMAKLTENLAWSLEFHRREAKPVFWRLFERLGLDEEELLDDLDCLAGCKLSPREPFKPTPRAKILAYEYTFDVRQEFKGNAKQFYLLGVTNEDGNTAKATLVEEMSDIAQGRLVLQMKGEPKQTLSLVPDEFVNPNPIPQAITQVVQRYAEHQLGECAILDFLQRKPPRITGHDGGPIAVAEDPKERLQQIIHAVKNLDNSYLTIQGPPGAGKSFTGKHIVAQLLQNGAKVGIASNSHKAINHLLLSCAQYATAKKIPGVFACTKETESALRENNVVVLKNAELANFIEPACVVGTTAWGFARDDMQDQLDYLIVDEAGQVAVANLIAMSRAAKNMVLMGDQMQLGQPSQGTHPAESGLSILDYLLHDAATIRDDMGVFLGTTYRMHSAVNGFISRHIYENKLHAHPDNDRRRIKVPEHYIGPLDKDAGIVFVPVAHEGNTQASDEEVARIKSLAGELLGREFCDIDGCLRPITWPDILFVAPYNHQVTKLKQALGEQAKVGSVDKFQGQEAPIVFLSFCASDAGESPRGLSFLLDRHRINVAISRAQCLAIVVANPAIGLTAVNNIEQLTLLNTFNALLYEAQNP